MINISKHFDEKQVKRIFYGTVHVTEQFRNISFEPKLAVTKLFRDITFEPRLTVTEPFSDIIFELRLDVTEHFHDIRPMGKNDENGFFLKTTFNPDDYFKTFKVTNIRVKAFIKGLIGLGNFILKTK
uniref:Uncharacterized protein n=1 Tax=Cuerna arida TaxID=1464854 RepID=A0A1B6ES87_9HEMI